MAVGIYIKISGILFKGAPAAAAAVVVWPNGKGHLVNGFCECIFWIEAKMSRYVLFKRFQICSDTRILQFDNVRINLHVALLTRLFANQSRHISCLKWQGMCVCAWARAACIFSLLYVSSLGPPYSERLLSWLQHRGIFFSEFPITHNMAYQQCICCHRRRRHDKYLHDYKLIRQMLDEW